MPQKMFPAAGRAFPAKRMIYIMSNLYEKEKLMYDNWKRE